MDDLPAPRSPGSDPRPEKPLAERSQEERDQFLDSLATTVRCIVGPGPLRMRKPQPPPQGDCKFNAQLAGVISVWRDPADGHDYVVDGHHRLELARRLGVSVLNVQYLHAPDATTARAQGAFINMAQGRGTATDVALFLRETGTTPEDLAKRGISLPTGLTRDAVALARLAPDVFDQVATGNIPRSWGTAIGALLEDPVHQRETLRAARGSRTRLSGAVVGEIARQVRDCRH